VAVDFAADEMLVRDAEGLPTGERVAPPPGPWDDAFTGIHGDPALTWPGTLRLTLSSTCPWWVVYTAPPNAVCVEPQSGPPDAVNATPEVVEPGRPLTHTMRWGWDRLG
jgi:aldose 1-epimerase